MRAAWAALVLGLCVLTPAPSLAAEFRLLNVGIRGGADGVNVFGADEFVHFQQYDLFATATLPRDWRFDSGWGFSPRLMGTAGVLIGAGEAGFVGTVVPVLAFGPSDPRWSLDAGVGAALMTRHKYGEQNFGGAFQVVLTFGFRIPIYKALGIGYRLAHMSDAKIYGEGRGLDAHMLELTYTFR